MAKQEIPRCLAGKQRRLFMSPTGFRSGPFRFYFFSREEPRMHVHVSCGNAEAKFWLEPTVALALDATVVRSILVPATMRLLGDRNWYLPSWLGWLPRIDIDGGASSASALEPLEAETRASSPRRLTHA